MNAWLAHGRDQIGAPEFPHYRVKPLQQTLIRVAMPGRDVANLGASTSHAQWTGR